MTSVTRSPGSIRNVTAAVFIAPRLVAPAPAAPANGTTPAPANTQVQKRSAQELDALRQVVVNALGLKPAAGQSLDSLVSLQELEFQGAERAPGQVEAVAGETPLQKWFELGSHWGAILGAVGMLLIFWRMLSRQKLEAVPIEVLALRAADTARAGTGMAGVTPEMLNELIRQKPANVGVALRDWVAAEAAPAGKN